MIMRSKRSSTDTTAAEQVATKSVLKFQIPTRDPLLAPLVHERDAARATVNTDVTIVAKPAPARFPGTEKVHMPEPLIRDVSDTARWAAWCRGTEGDPEGCAVRLGRRREGFAPSSTRAERRERPKGCAVEGRKVAGAA
ncbi:hypothetical protein WME91_39210 [Sorangium sp. So ce269]